MTRERTNMFRKLLLLAALLPFAANAADTLFWRMEGTTLSSPASDFSAGDTSAAGTGSPSISATAAKVGSNGVLTAAGANSYFTLDSASIVNKAVGSAGYWLQWKVFPNTGLDANGFALRNTGATNDVISVRSSGTDEIRLQIRAAAGSQLFLASTSCNMVIDTWYFIIVRWDIANDDREISCYNSAGTLIQKTEDLTTDLAAAEPATIDVIRIGNNSSSTDALWVDNLHVSQTYNEPIENFMSITAFAPTYSAGPTNGSFTNTTLPFTYTPDQNGTTYAVACTNGQTVTTFANLKANTCSGGAGNGTIGTDTSVAGVGDSVTITGLTAGTTYDVYIGHESNIGGQSTITNLADRATTSTAVNLTAVTVTAATDGYTVAGTCTGTGTLSAEAVACALGDAAPTSNELELGQCGGGNVALMNAQENWTTAVPNDFLLTSANKPMRLNVYLGCTNGTTDAANVTNLDKDRTARTNYSYIFPTSIATTSIFDRDAYFTPDVLANKDGAEYENRTDEAANCKVLFGVTGDHVYYDRTDGINTQNLLPGVNETGDAGNDAIDDCAGKRTFNISYEQHDSATTGLFTAPASVGIFTADDIICNGNRAPTSILETQDQVVVLIKNAVMTTRDLSASFQDLDADVLTLAATLGTFPTGTSMTSAGVWSGTPTVENESGVSMQVTGTDNCGDTGVIAFSVYVTDDTIVAPNCSTGSVDVAACLALLATVRPWLDASLQLTATFAYSPTITVNKIISQNPAAAGTLTSTQPLAVVVSLGVQPKSGRFSLGLLRDRLDL